MTEAMAAAYPGVYLKSKPKAGDAPLWILPEAQITTISGESKALSTSYHQTAESLRDSLQQTGDGDD